MKILTVALSSIMLSVLAACGGGGSTGPAGVAMAPPAGAISGTVTKGPMNNATVTAYGLSAGQPGAPIASATTDAQGNFSMNVGRYAGAVMLQVSGGSYTDEATGTPMTMDPGDVITAVMPSIAAGSSSSGVQVTPVTAMAQAMANHLAGGMTDANIAAANAAMGNYFAVPDILHTAPMNPLVAGSGNGASAASQNYGLTMAAMSKYAQSQGMSSSSAIVTAMMNDASDGVIDGKAAGVPVQMGSMAGASRMPADAGSSGMGAAMGAFLASAQNKSGVSSSMLVNSLMGMGMGGQPPAVGAGTPGAGGAAVVAGATLSGTVFDGPVSRAMVVAFGVNQGVVGAQIASVATDGQGRFTLPLGSYTGPVMLQAMGGVFTDEATGATTMAGHNLLSAVLPTVASGATVAGVWITPLTSMAQSRATALAGGMTDANISAANKALGDYFSVSDVLHVQPMSPLLAGAGASASPDARNYGMTLAAMSQYAKDLNLANSSAVVTALMRDAADGVMDGKSGTSPITMSGSMGGGMMGSGTPMAASAGTSGLAAALTSFMSSAANASGVTATDMAALIQKLSNSDGHV